MDFHRCRRSMFPFRRLFASRLAGGCRLQSPSPSASGRLRPIAGEGEIPSGPRLRRQFERFFPRDGCRVAGEVTISGLVSSEEGFCVIRFFESF